MLWQRRTFALRTEKIEDYARSGIGEYQLTTRDPNEPLRPQAFAVAIDPRDTWAALD